MLGSEPTNLMSGHSTDLGRQPVPPPPATVIGSMRLSSGASIGTKGDKKLLILG